MTTDPVESHISTGTSTSAALPNPRIDWSVLDWNQSAIRFYQSLGAVPMDEWTGYRLSGEALAALGSTDHWQE